MNKDSEGYLEPIAFVAFHYVNEVSSISSSIETEKNIGEKNLEMQGDATATAKV